MLRLISDHPFLYGVVTTLALSIVLFGNFADLQNSTGARSLGLIVFGSAIALLLYQTHDRDDVFWFFLGGVITLVVSFLVSLKI